MTKTTNGDAAKDMFGKIFIGSLIMLIFYSIKIFGLIDINLGMILPAIVVIRVLMTYNFFKSKITSLRDLPTLLNMDVALVVLLMIAMVLTDYKVILISLFMRIDGVYMIYLVIFSVINTNRIIKIENES